MSSEHPVVIPSLDQIARHLEALEESIIYKLLDRAQFARNGRAYQPGLSGLESYPAASLVDARLDMQETMDARFGRFLVPEERPFMRGLPAAERSMPRIPLFPIPDLEVISQTREIKSAYFDILDRLCPPGDDGQYGSSVEHDVYALQALGRRIHYGALYVSEAKYRMDPERYRALVSQGDGEGIMMALTRLEVEARILDRVSLKVDSIQADLNPEVRRRVDPGTILAFYRDTVIPLTKAGELAYLMNRRPD